MWKMNALIIIGIILGASIMVTDRFIRNIPSRLAVVLYVVALVLIIAGMIVSRTR